MDRIWNFDLLQAATDGCTSGTGLKALGFE